MEQYIVPSKRTYPLLGLQREDDNIFFTCLCLRIIQDFDLDHPLAEKYDPAVFEDFVEVIDGAKLYLFWKDQPNAYFPNGRFMHKHRFFRSPPDADDSSLIYYLIDHKPAAVEKYFEALRSFANTSQKRNMKCKSIYRDKKIFSTWFGSGKMPVEFDLVVIINIFYSLEKYSYPMDGFYVDSIGFVKNEVLSRGYIKSAFSSSPNYPSPVIIYYTVCRFLYFHPDHELASLQPSLAEHSEPLERQAKSAFDLLLLDSALMFLGTPTKRGLDVKELQKESEHFPFFIAGLITLLPGKLSWWLARYRPFHLHFACKTYNDLLIRENQALRGRLD